MTQPPIVPGPYDPSEGWEPTAPQPPAPPGYYPPQSAPPVQPVPPPQVIYVQAPGVTSREVSSGIVDAGMTWIYVLLAIFVGIPATCCLGWFLIYGLGKIFG